jgi:arginase
MTRVVLIEAPYHLGREGVGLGKGVPVLSEALRDGTETRVVDRGGEVRNEIAASMDVIRALALEVRRVAEEGVVPVVLAGNCNSALGTVAGLGSPRGLGVVWLDAHADFNTPETSESGFFDGMALAMLTGAGWEQLRKGVPDLWPLPEEQVLLVGARDLGDGERRRLARASLLRAGAEDVEARLADLAERVGNVYLHVDLDVLDPSAGRANWFACDGGLSVEDVERVVDAVARRFVLAAAALTAYQPDADGDATIPRAARRIFERIVAAVAEGAPA